MLNVKTTQAKSECFVKNNTLPQSTLASLNTNNTAKADKANRRKAVLFRGFLIAFLVLICFLQIFPFYLKIIDSMHGIEFLPDYDKIYFLPQMGTLYNYVRAFVRGDLLIGLVNSLIHTVSFTLLSLIFAFIMGYVFGKLTFKGKNVVFIMLLSTMMVPGEVLMIPNFLLVQKLGLTNNLLGIILPGLVNIFGIFLIKQYMNTIPDSVLESASLEGANEVTKIFKIVFPMCIPIIITYVILTFTNAWNEYLWPMIILKDEASFTLQLKMYQFYPKFGGAADGFVRSAGMILISLPIIVMYLFLQKYFLQSVNIAGLK